VAGSPGELRARSEPAARGYPEGGAPVRFSGMLAGFHCALELSPQKEQGLDRR
jgi:hypothetical protein